MQTTNTNTPTASVTPSDKFKQLQSLSAEYADALAHGDKEAAKAIQKKMTALTKPENESKTLGRTEVINTVKNVSGTMGFRFKAAKMAWIPILSACIKDFKPETFSPGIFTETGVKVAENKAGLITEAAMNAAIWKALTKLNKKTLRFDLTDEGLTRIGKMAENTIMYKIVA